MRITLSAVLFLFTTALLADGALQWEQKKQDDGITVSLADYHGESGKAFKSETTLNFPMEKVLAQFTKSEKFQTWFHLCNFAQPLEQDDAGFSLYMRIDMPWPVQDRDLVYFLEKKAISPKEVHYVVGHKNDRYPASESHIRFPKIGGTWVFTDLGNNQTHIVWEQYQNAGGNIPTFIANMAAVDVGFKSIQNFRKQLEASK